MLRRIKKIARSSLIVLLIFLWAFSGIETLFSPRINDARAADITIVLDDSTGTQWTVPDDWSNTNTIHVIGGGGAGRNSTTKSGGGGGGGYSRIENTTQLSAGQTVNYFAASGAGFVSGNAQDGGDTYLCNSQSNCSSLADSAVIIGAEGGNAGPSGGSAGNGGSGGLAANGVITGTGQKYSGGAGGTGTQNGGNGGGGGAGGPSGDGENGGNGDTTTSGDDAGGGGGGAGGASSTIGSNGTATFGAGGHGPGGTGGGATAGANGTAGGGGAGGAHGATGGNGGNSLLWKATSSSGPCRSTGNGCGPAGGGGGGGNGGGGGWGGTTSGNIYDYGGGGGGGNNDPGLGLGKGGVIVIIYTQAVQTQLGDGTDPGNSTIAPGASATEIDRFSFKTTTGTDNVTALTVTLAPANAYTNVATVDVQTTGGSSKCSATPSSNTVSLTNCAISVTTSITSYKIMVTPKTHANMASPATGASYGTTATVTNWTGTNTHSGTDTDSATITIDNDSPDNVSSATAASSIESQVALAWTNPGDSDFDNVIVLQRASSAVADTPTEGSTYATSSTIGSSTVVCSGLVTSCSVTSLSSSTAYHYKIFAKDSRGNWSDSGTTPTGSPVTPSAGTLTLSAYRFFDDSTSVTPGTALEVQDTAATLAAAGDPFRMRILVHVGTNGIASSGRTMKLQYSPKSGTCDSSFTGEDYHDMSATTTIAYYDVGGISDNSALGAQADLTHGGDTIVNQTYEEANTFTNSQSSILSGQDGKWDFSLYDNGGTAGASYCIRAVTDTETEFSSYTVVPEIVISLGDPDITLLHYRWRKDNKSETDTNWAESEDAIHNSGVFVGDRRRLRFVVSNEGEAAASNITYQLEYSESCSSWTAVPNMESSDPWTMSLSTYVTNEMATTNNSGLTDPGGYAFVAGVGKSGSNITSAHTLQPDEFTELEFVLRSTDTVSTDTTYCFRITNAGSTTNFSYSVMAQISIPNQARPQKASGGNISTVGEGAPVEGGTEEAPPPIEEEGTGTPTEGGTEGGGGGSLE